jgi:hypothetical protein
VSDDRRGEDAFFEGQGPDAPPLPPRPPRRETPLLRRSPAFAALALAVSGWLLSSLWGDVTYFFTSRAPIDLGGPGAYHLQDARENRLVQIRGELAERVPVTAGRSGDHRTVGRLAGTNLLVDRPGLAGPPVYEGRLLPSAARSDYAGAAAALRERGAALDERWLVLRDGDRPRRRWGPVLGAALLLAVALVNLRALVKGFFS